MSIRKVHLYSRDDKYNPKAPYPHVRINSDGSISGFDSDFWYIKEDAETHEGLVVGRETDPYVRIMSDVWADLYYALVWNPDLEKVERVPVGDSEFAGGTQEYQVVVDAPADIMIAFEAWKAGRAKGKALRERMSEYDAREQRTQEERQTPRRGKTVRVIKGRKLPLGTEGLVFWVGGDRFGNTKLGIATSDRKDSRGFWADVKWTYAQNVEVIRQHA